MELYSAYYSHLQLPKGMEKQLDGESVRSTPDTQVSACARSPWNAVDVPEEKLGNGSVHRWPSYLKTCSPQSAGERSSLSVAPSKGQSRGRCAKQLA